MAKLGNEAKCYLTTAMSEGEYTWLKGEQNNSFTRTAEAIEVSDKSTDWSQYISGKKGATAEVTVFSDNTTGEPQHKVLESLYKGVSVFVFIGKLGEMNKPEEGDMFEAIVTNIGDTNDYGAVSTRSISLQVTGKPEHYPTIVEA